MGSRRRRHKRRTGTGFILALVLVIFCAISYARVNLNHRRMDLIEKDEQVQQQLADEKERSDQIEDLSAYVQTKKFVEETAREKLGLVYKDEVIFKSEDKK